MQDGAADSVARWFACRTRSRAENRVGDLLDRSGFESYVPRYARVRQWSDRKKSVEFALFPGYMFSRFEPTRLADVLRTPGLVDVVRVAGRPAPVSEEELNSVRALLRGARRAGIKPHPAHFLEPGQSVRVVSGPFSGMRGTLTEKRGRSHVVVRLRTLRQAVAVEMDRRHLVRESYDG